MSGYKLLISAVLLVIIGAGALLSVNYYKEGSSDSALNAKVTAANKESDKEKESMERKPGAIVYQIPGMERVRVTKDIVYKTDKTAVQKLDVYYPMEDGSGNKPYPVILIHGSTSDENFKDRAYFDSWGRLIAASGYAAVTFNWRSGAVPKDISDLMVYVREHIDELGVDSKGVSVIAFSLGVENGVREVLSADSGYVDSIVTYYGKLPLSVLENRMGNELPPMFIAKAGLEKYFPPDCNNEFISREIDSGGSITEVVHQNGVHGFDVFTDDDRTREIIKESLTFIENNKYK